MPPAPTFCPLCDAPAPVASDRIHTEAGTSYTLYICNNCSVWFWWPLKNPGATWYSAHERYGARNHDPMWKPTGYHRKAITLLSPKKGTILDVGCGIGNFLDLANQEGWVCAGIDFDPDAIDAARKRIGTGDLSVSDVVIYAQQHPENKFDVVTFFDVFEHVDNHNEFIGAVSSLVKDNGSIAMSMPYRKHAPWLMRGDVPPCHLTCWDRGSLKGFLTKHGFTVTHMSRRTEGIWPIIMKLRFKYGRRISFGAVNAIKRTVGDAISSPRKQSTIVKMVKVLAKVKDIVVFGLPAVCIWLAMIPLESRYVTLFAIAEKRTR